MYPSNQTTRHIIGLLYPSNQLPDNQAIWQPSNHAVTRQSGNLATKQPGIRFLPKQKDFKATRQPGNQTSRTLDKHTGLDVAYSQQPDNPSNIYDSILYNRKYKSPYISLLTINLYQNYSWWLSPFLTAKFTVFWFPEMAKIWSFIGLGSNFLRPHWTVFKFSLKLLTWPSIFPPTFWAGSETPWKEVK